MSEAPPDRPFTRKALIDGDTLVGARWWQESLRLSAEPLSRRRALKGLLLLLGGSAAGLGLFAALSQPADELDVTMDALDLQKHRLAEAELTLVLISGRLQQRAGRLFHGVQKPINYLATGHHHSSR